MPIFWNFLTAEKSRYKAIYCMLISAYAKAFSIKKERKKERKNVYLSSSHRIMTKIE
jgi:hypothetical protein